MTMKTIGGALALPLMLCAHPVAAQTTGDATTDIMVQAVRADGHGPAGMMGDHTHAKGGLMLGLSYMHDDYGGTNRTGTQAIGGDAIGALGFAAYTQSMRMDMAMLHIMYAPSDRLTLMIAPSWQRMTMTMVGTGAVTTGHHAMARGETMSESVSGLGDTQAMALVTLTRSPHLSLHAGAGVSIPTGSVTQKDADGNFVHYGMQPGSGTWDLLPQLTLRGWHGRWGWGAQTGYVFRTQRINRSGYRLGDRFTASSWSSYALSPRASLSARIAFQTEGVVEGHYNAGHNHASPPDRQANYGGERIEAGLGGNIVIGNRLRLGLEASLPLYQRVNGVQAPKRWGISSAVTTMF